MYRSMHTEDDSARDLFACDALWIIGIQGTALEHNTVITISCRCLTFQLNMTKTLGSVGPIFGLLCIYSAYIRPINRGQLDMCHVRVHLNWFTY